MTWFELIKQVVRVPEACTIMGCKSVETGWPVVRSMMTDTPA